LFSVITNQTNFRYANSIIDTGFCADNCSFPSAYFQLEESKERVALIKRESPKASLKKLPAHRSEEGGSD